MPTTNQQLPDQITDQEEVLPNKDVSTSSGGFLDHTFNLSELNPSTTNLNCEDSNILKARRLLGAHSSGLTNDQVKTIITELQFLADTWLDEFEKTTFQGMSVTQVVNGRKDV